MNFILKTLKKVQPLSIRSFSSSIESHSYLGINREKLVERPIFIDNQATTPIDPRVFDAMIPHMSRDFGNPHSTAHVYGTEQMKI